MVPPAAPPLFAPQLLVIERLTLSMAVATAAVLYIVIHWAIVARPTPARLAQLMVIGLAALLSLPALVLRSFVRPMK